MTKKKQIVVYTDIYAFVWEPQMLTKQTEHTLHDVCSTLDFVQTMVTVGSPDIDRL